MKEKQMNVVNVRKKLKTLYPFNTRLKQKVVWLYVLVNKMYPKD